MSKHGRNQVETIVFDDHFLRIRWEDQSESKCSLVWLRDNCAEDRDPRNGQRLLDILDLPEQPKIKELMCNKSEGLISILWMDKEGRSQFSCNWLKNQCDGLEVADFRVKPPVLWDRDQSSKILKVSYSEIKSSRQAQLHFLESLAEFGIAFLSDVPSEPGQILKVSELFGYVRETNYGKLFEVRSVSNPNNLAYTDLGLGLHTDNPYRDPVPGLQLLHCLQASPEGGENTFVDGFKVAEALQEMAPKEFDLLTKTPVPFVFQDQTADLRAEWPLIQVNLRKQVIAIHYNNRSMATLHMPHELLSEFYRAYRLFSKTTKDARFEYSTKLMNGDLVIFDNQRILHGRKAFNAQSGSRHLQGCYVDRDGLFSNLAVLQSEMSRKSTATQ